MDRLRESIFGKKNEVNNNENNSQENNILESEAVVEWFSYEYICSN